MNRNTNEELCTLPFSYQITDHIKNTDNVHALVISAYLSNKKMFMISAFFRVSTSVVNAHFIEHGFSQYVRIICTLAFND